MRARYSRTNKPHKATKIGIYDKHKSPGYTPKSTVLQVNLPNEYIVALMSIYPDFTLYKAVKTPLMKTIQIKFPPIVIP